MDLSLAARQTAGILLLSFLAVEVGGLYLVRVVNGAVPRTAFQVAFARAGHAHAGVLVLLGLVVQPYADAVAFDGLLAFVARSGIPLAAILMSAGFFLASGGRGASAPNGLVVLVYAGAGLLAAGVATLGLGLLAA